MRVHWYVIPSSVSLVYLNVPLRGVSVTRDDDAEFVARLVTGSVAAFEDLVARYQQPTPTAAVTPAHCRGRRQRASA